MGRTPVVGKPRNAVAKARLTDAEKAAASAQARQRGFSNESDYLRHLIAVDGRKLQFEQRPDQ